MTVLLPVDPPVEASGCCAVCGGPRPDAAVMHADPFCSSPCARAYHGTSLPTAEWGPASKRECLGCGVPLNERSEGCAVCARRHEARARLSGDA